MRTEDKETTGWHLLATAYGRDNQFGMAALALAKEGLPPGKKKDAMQQALRATALLPKNSPGCLWIENIHREAEHLDESAGGFVNIR
jgi:predicted Zn-dependent protease